MPSELTESGDSPVEPGWVRVVESGEGRFAEHLFDGRHLLRADEPASAGGTDRGPGPYELLLMALGACTTMTLRLYADRKQWKLGKIEVLLRHGRVHAQDCAECETKQALIDHIDVVIKFDGELDDEKKQRLLEIADKCPVHRTLISKVEITTNLAA